MAANHLRTTQGGLVAVAQGEVVADLPLPLAGLQSTAPLSQVAHGLRVMREAMDKLVDWEPPFLVFKALFGASLVCNAGPRLSDLGLVDPFQGILRESCVLEEL